MARALLVAHHYPPHIGGLGMVVYQQAMSMAQSGHDVAVLTSQYGRTDEQDAAHLGVEVLRLPCSHILERLFSIPFPLFHHRLISETWKQVRNADVVHVHDVFYMSSWVAVVFAAIARRPMVLTQHVAMVEHSNPLVMLAQRLVYATIGRWSFARSRHIVVYNENVSAFLRNMGVPASRISFLSNGIDTQKFRPASAEERIAIRRRLGLPVDRPLVLFVGRLVEKKGYQILLKAQDKAYDLVFAGPGAIPAGGRTQGVHWTGPVDQDLAADLYRACDLFAFPAVGEIFTLVMQEALACGLPVITTDDPAYVGSAVADCVVLCHRDSDAFKSSIQRLLADRPRLLRLGVRSRQVAVQHFDWRTNISRLLEVYADVLHRGT